MDLLSNLNPQQREAVCMTEGPLLILAGAGSGKTRVITHRIAHLISEKGMASHRILAVTFTNKAAGEMKDRVEALLGERAKGLWVSTFHSTCARVLRRHAGRIGLPTDFALYDAADQMVLVKECFSELNLNEELYPPRTVLGRIGRLKHRLIEPEEFGRSASPFGLDEKVYRVYLRYQEKLARAGGLDFDDLIGGAIRLFETAPDLLAGYQEQFRYIMVDEYQDTNHAQYRLVNLLARRHGNLCVVGDDDQSIYAFRGADVTNILSFERDYPTAHVITLGQNYRSTQSILDAASTVIAKNPRRKEKRLFTEKAAGDRPTWCRVADEMEEARYLCRTIRRLKREDGLDYANFCVLYRTNAQSRVIEEAFRSEEIPYLIVGGLKFYERKEVKDLIAFLRVIVNPSDNVA
ncbi:MAG TPA: UvrD-helicase domain-containing protein, partial [Nitrospiria bacterium]|nr:UvrD-helicase domain-containing protein [Nitrospiria bacterium]